MFIIKSKLLFNFYLSKYLNKDRLLFYLIFFSIFVIVFNFIKYKTIMLDDYVWVNLSEDFFDEIGISDGRHRPLFGFLGYLINIFIKNTIGFLMEDSIKFSWRIMNFTFLFFSVILSYFTINKICNNKTLAFIFSLFVLTSPQLIYGLSLGVPLIHGFFIFYLSVFLFVDFIYETDLKKSTRKLILYSFIIGVLMLGKAHYNIVFTIFLASFLRLRVADFKNGLFFLIIQAIPLLLYIFILNLNGFEYKNYEYNRGDFSLINFIFTTFIDRNVSLFVNLWNFYNLLNMSPLHMLKYGSGLIFSSLLFISLIYKLFSLRAVLILIYFYSTSGILLLTSFSIPRHAGDFEPIVFFFLASCFFYFYNYFSFKKIIKTIYFIFFLVIFYISQSGIYWAEVHGQNFQQDFPLRFEILNIFNLY